MTTLVTGATGRVGRELVSLRRSRGERYSCARAAR